MSIYCLWFAETRLTQLKQKYHLIFSFFTHTPVAMTKFPFGKQPGKQFTYNSGFIIRLCILRDCHISVILVPLPYTFWLNIKLCVTPVESFLLILTDFCFYNFLMDCTFFPLHASYFVSTKANKEIKFKN